MRVLVATVQVPFVRGGAEVLADGLLQGLRDAGHQAEVVAIPFGDFPLSTIFDQMLACRLLNLVESAGVTIDRVIGLKFPAYLIPHPNKVLWIIHQYRATYDLWEHHYGFGQFAAGTQIRAAIREADMRFIPEAKAVYTISRTVSRRLNRFCKFDSTPLYPPLDNATAYHCAVAHDYLFFPSRITPLKRQHLVINALAATHQPVRVRFAGSIDDRAYGQEMHSMVERLGLMERVEWLGRISDAEKIRQFAHALAVVFPPDDEDYGYVTLEAMAAGKPVITCTDSGGPLEFVVAGETGIASQPTPDALAAAMDEVWADRKRAMHMGHAARERYSSLDLSWSNVVERLLA